MSDMLPPVVARLKANITDFQAGMAQAKGEMTAVGGKGQAAAKMVSKAFVVGGAIAAAAVVAFGVKSASTYKQVGSDVLKLQKYTGQSAEEASKLRFQMQQTGVSVDAGAKALAAYSRRVLASKDPQRDFGFAVRDSAGHVKPMSVLLGEASEKFRSMDAGAARTAWVLKNFGRSGMDMTKFLALGKKGLADLAAQAEKYGLVLTDQNLHAVKEAIKGHREQEAAMQGLQVQVGQHVLPVLTKLTTFIATAIPASTKYVSEHAAVFKVLGGAVTATVALFLAYKAAVVANTIVTGAWTAASTIAAAAQWAVSSGAESVALSAMYAGEALAGEAAAAGLLTTAASAAAAGLVAFVGTTKLLNSLSATHADLEGLATDLDRLADKGGSVSDVADSLGTDVDGLADAFDRASDSPGGFGEAIGYLGTHLSSDLGGTKLRQAQDRISQLDETLAKAAKGGHAKQAADAYAKVSEAMQKQGISAKVVQELLPKYAEAQFRAAQAALDAAKGTDRGVEAKEGERAKTPAQIAQIKAANKAYGEWKKAVDADYAALDRLQKLKLGSLNANIAYQQAVSDETEAIKANGATIDINTQKGRDNTNAAAASRAAIMQQAQAMKENGGSAHEAAAFIRAHTLKLNEQEIAAGLSKDQVAYLNAEMGMTPKEVDTAFKVDTTAAQRAVNDYNVWLINHPGQHTTYLVTRGQSAIREIKEAGQNADGTDYWRGGLTWVGERGPELIDLPQGSKVLSHERSLDLMRRLGRRGDSATPAPVSDGGSIQHEWNLGFHTDATPESIQATIGYAARTLTTVAGS